MLLHLGAVEEVPEEYGGRGFYLQYFFIPEKGDLCPILDPEAKQMPQILNGDSYIYRSVSSESRLVSGFQFI